MATQRLRSLSTEFIYRVYMTNILTLSSSNRAACKQQVLNLDTIRPNQVNFGEKGLRAPGPKKWNNLP